MVNAAAGQAHRGALAGLKVLDLSRVLAGPLCAQLLADHGAYVLKVEPPAGDETRGWGPVFHDDDSSAYFSGMNRNKSNLCLDLRHAEGMRLLRRLLSEADVLVENFKAGTLARWGLTDAEIGTRYPALVHLRVSGYGTGGPLGGAPGYDAVVQAFGGLMSVNGDPDRPPVRLGVPIVDMVTAFLSFSGVLMALRERDRTGRGQMIDAALLDSVAAILHPHAGTWLYGGMEPQRTGSAHPSIAPYDTYEAADGLFFLGVGNDRQFRLLCEHLGEPGLATDSRFLTNRDRADNYAELKPVLSELIRHQEVAALHEALARLGVPGGPVHSVPQALTAPQMLHREMVVGLGEYRGIADPIKLTRTPPSVRTAPRRRGQDTREVLAAMGLSEQDIEALFADGVVLES